MDYKFIIIAALANLALPAILPAPANIAASIAKRPRRPFNISKDTYDEYQPDDFDSESKRAHRRQRLDESDGESSSTHQPLPDVFEKSNIDKIMNAIPNNVSIVKKVKTTKSHFRGDADKILKNLRIGAQKKLMRVSAIF